VRRSDDYRQMQERVALADAIEVAMATGKVPQVRLAGGDGGGDDDEPLDKKIARIMRENGWNASKFDLAATQALKEHGLRGEGYGKPIHSKPGSKPLSP